MNACLLIACAMLFLHTAQPGIPILSAQQIRPTDTLSVKRIGHQSQPLGNGKVLVFGGQTNNQLFQPVIHASCEIFDGATEQWTSAASMHTARNDFASVVLQDGRILAIGGSNDKAQPLSSVESYDPATDTWTVVGSLKEARKNIDAILLDNGTVLVMGHERTSFETGSADGSNWTLHDYPALSYNFPESPRMIRLPDSRILAVGNQAGPYRNWAVLITQSLVADTTTFPMIEDHPQAGVALLPDGKVLVTGGTSSCINEIFDPVAETFTATDVFLFPHYGCPLMTMADGRIAVLSTGTITNPGDTQILEVYTPSDGQWTLPQSHDFTATNKHAVSPLGNNKYLISGGQSLVNLTSVGTALCYIFDAGGTVGVAEQQRTPTAVQYHESSHSIHIYRPEQDEEYSAVLLNMAGQVIANYSLRGRYNTALVPTTADGMYLVRIIAGAPPYLSSHKILISN